MKKPSPSKSTSKVKTTGAIGPDQLADLTTRIDSFMVFSHEDSHVDLINGCITPEPPLGMSSMPQAAGGMSVGIWLGKCQNCIHSLHNTAHPIVSVWYFAHVTFQAGPAVNIELPKTPSSTSGI